MSKKGSGGSSKKTVPTTPFRESTKTGAGKRSINDSSTGFGREKSSVTTTNSTGPGKTSDSAKE